MDKRAKLSEFEKGDISALKRVGKSQRDMSKVSGRSKTVTCKTVQISTEQENPLAAQKYYHHDSREELFAKSKRKLRQHQKHWNL